MASWLNYLLFVRFPNVWGLMNDMLCGGRCVALWVHKTIKITPELVKRCHHWALSLQSSWGASNNAFSTVHHFGSTHMLNERFAAFQKLCGQQKRQQMMLTDTDTPVGGHFNKT